MQRKKESNVVSHDSFSFVIFYRCCCCCWHAGKKCKCTQVFFTPPPKNKNGNVLCGSSYTETKGSVVIKPKLQTLHSFAPFVSVQVK